MGRGAGVRLGVVAAIGLGLLAAAPGSAWAACSTVKEVTVDAVFQGKKCVSSGKLTLQGVSYEPDTGETLTGSISQVSREGRVTVGKQGNLIGPLFKGTLTSTSDTNLRVPETYNAPGIAATVSFTEVRTGVQMLPAVDGRYEGAVTITRDADAVRTTETRMQQGELRMTGFSGQVTLSTVRARRLDDTSEEEQTDLLLNGRWWVAGRSFTGPLHLTRTRTRTGGAVNETSTVTDGRAEETRNQL